ncbi:MAG TPA: PKD domain-containing protein [Anaeromyxobacter sp.]|nr:PKD domain-containing protein [Anaeromyxobacter sp.]
MSIRAYVYAMVALAAMIPATALAANTVTATVSPSVDVVAGSTVQIGCRAEGNVPTGMGSTTVVQVAITVSGVGGGGTVNTPLLTNAKLVPCTADPTKSCSVIEGSSAWVTPTSPGALTATCTGKFQGTFGSPTYVPANPTDPGPWTVALTTVPGTALPPAISGVNGPAEVVVDASAVYEAVATDPNTPPKALTYSWTATGGTVTQDATNPALAAWQAPASTGTYTLTVAVSNGTATVTADKVVNVAIAAYQASLPLPLGAPTRLASNGLGGVFVVDGSLPPGTIAVATARGEARGFARLPESVLAVATGAGYVWATTTMGNLYKVDPVTGRSLGSVALASGRFNRPAGIAYDPANMTLWVADQNADRVRVLTPDGATVAVLATVGGSPLKAPVDVAIDGASGKAFVAVLDPVKTDATDGYLLHVFDLATRAHVGSYVPRGSSLGQVSRSGGITVGSAGVYVSDAYQGVVQVVSATGAGVATIGSWGRAEGQLTTPQGLAVLANGDLAVANKDLSRIERFGAGNPLPTCGTVEQPDTDCDLLPDLWESTNGLNPSWAGDGLANLDGDGLNNAEELAAGTNPNAADTDGDGFSDSDELASGFDPRNPDDHKVMVRPSAPAESPPGLVKLSAVATGPGTCSVGWTQKGGPTVPLAGADTANASFVARAAASYEFDAIATCGGVMSAPGRAAVVVKNVPPMADAGTVVVAAPGSPIRLDALASSDANGGALAFAWDQMLGAPLVGSQTGGTLAARPRGAGLYAFQVTVSDVEGASSTAEVPVLVAEGQAPTAIAKIPADAQVGATVWLDASESVVPPGATFSWQEVARPASRPPATLTGANEAVASFVPQAEGRYAFEVTAGMGPLRAPPARVEVFVAAANGALPTVSAAAPPSIVAVGAPVALDATPSPSSAQVAWRQLSGPAAGLTGADSASATVVPFAAGYHVFEATVKDGAAEGHPTRVAFEARTGGAAIPQARIATPTGDAWVGQLVFLDGRASTGAARFRWTQVAGPWVAFGTQASVATVRPLAVGRYVFQLVVDDGVTRSAPATVEVNVVSGEAQ